MKKKHEAEIDQELARRASVCGWSRDHPSKVFTGILGSPKSSAFEKKKQPYTTQIMSMAMSGPPECQKADPKATCANGLRLKTIVGHVQAINAREYAFILGEVKAAK